MKLTMKTLAISLILSLFALPLCAAPDATKIDINTATVEQLQELPRIGPKIAQRVIEYREKSGGFQQVEELMNVRGVGPKVFESLKDQIVAGSTTKKANAGKDAGR